MALSPLNWRMCTPRTLPVGYTVTTILDALYAMGQDTTYADGTARSVGSGSAWTWTRDTTLAGYNTACIGTPPINALGMAYIVAGDTVARAPTMNTDTWSTNAPIVGMNKVSGAYSSWVNALPMTSGYFSGYVRTPTTVSVGTTRPNSLYLFESQEGFLCVWLGGTSSTPVMWGGGAIIDPLSAAALNAETDGRLYSVYTSGGSTFSSATILSNGVGIFNSLTSVNDAHMFTFNVGNVNTTRNTQKVGDFAPTINFTAPNGELPLVPLSAVFATTGQYAGQFRQLSVVKPLTTGSEQNVQGVCKGYAVGYQQQADGATFLLSY